MYCIRIATFELEITKLRLLLVLVYLSVYAFACSVLVDFNTRGVVYWNNVWRNTYLKTFFSSSFQPRLNLF